MWRITLGQSLFLSPLFPQLCHKGKVGFNLGSWEAWGFGVSCHKPPLGDSIYMVQCNCQCAEISASLQGLPSALLENNRHYQQMEALAQHNMPRCLHQPHSSLSLKNLSPGAFLMLSGASPGASYHCRLGNDRKLSDHSFMSSRENNFFFITYNYFFPFCGQRCLYHYTLWAGWLVSLTEFS